jgi:hypothetical protein
MVNFARGMPPARTPSECRNNNNAGH